MESQKPLILDQNLQDLEVYMKKMGLPGFRARQIWLAIYQSFKSSFDEISTLPKSLREQMEEKMEFEAISPVRTLKSVDKQTIKTLFKLRDGNLIEAVLMLYDQRRTLCISTQSGCGLGCSFCATGQMGLHRNLSSGEIIAQVLFFARQLAQTGEKVTNIVLMGMGEPFNNYEEVMKALSRLNNPEGFGLGARRFTISTVGLAPQIIQFADEETQYNLAISLHTVHNELRSSMIPVNRKYSVDKVIAACRYYVKKTGRRVTFEYALIKGVNDSDGDAQALAAKLSGLICHVNVIPLNPTVGFDAQATDPQQVKLFCKILEDNHISCTVRLRRGIEIQAGCGQLAADFNKKTA